MNVEIVDEIIEIVVNPEGKIHSYEAPEIPQESWVPEYTLTHLKLCNYCMVKNVALNSIVFGCLNKDLKS